MTEQELTKKCCKCKVDKPYSAFSKDRSSKDGLQFRCKQCYKEYVSENKDKICVVNKAYRESHKEEKSAQDKLYRDSHKEEIAEVQRIYRETNRDSLLVGKREYYKKHRDRILAYQKAYSEENREALAEGYRRYYEAHKAEIDAYQREYGKNNRATLTANGARWRNANPEMCAEFGRKWRQANPGKVKAIKAKRRAAKLQATPLWSETESIAEIYATAIELTKSEGITYHVDHIVPLQSDLVCGLHCLANLQILTKRENLRKSNLHWPDMP
jgi:hypothetical protein